MPNSLEEIYEDKIRRRSVELRLNPVGGEFDIKHLKEIHRRLFQDLPKGYQSIHAGEFRSYVGENLTRAKDRDWRPRLEMIVRVTYSPMDQNSVDELEKILKSVNPKRFSELNKAMFTNTIADLYARLDYIHPFHEGNSRALREFTYELAKASGFDLEWKNIDKKENGRNLLYIARDLAVIKIIEDRADAQSKEQLNAMFQPYYESQISLKSLLSEAISRDRLQSRDNGYER
ncbi:MAG: Fic family protein [Helicobacteraceae bacterium]|jgi:cell filamentation protein|nr:Fic family protein [Helicobacteraceae bacterium]